MNHQFVELAAKLDRESWEWLNENHPTIADAVAVQVQRGATPEQLRAFVLRRCGVNRMEFARRVESAARRLKEQAA